MWSGCSAARSRRYGPVRTGAQKPNTSPRKPPTFFLLGGSAAAASAGAALFVVARSATALLREPSVLVALHALRHASLARSRLKPGPHALVAASHAARRLSLPDAAQGSGRCGASHAAAPPGGAGRAATPEKGEESCSESCSS